ncbi:metallophosphoesterase [Actinacidiphila oryziradicis]|uniref:metallophosphoesterase family protein n=1 Tax=Actinacidiphila oryziradicis TaxID=2571141 RepID=UPI0023F489D5|nr:metallophosphoesterase [Actinacidiphila oryziradicis]MCW2874688.1 rane protein [Actinacidiphila oryziradicis]
MVELVRIRHAHNPSPTPTPRLYVRGIILIAVTLLGGWLGLVVLGTIDEPVGPMNTRMSLHPALSGGTQVNVSPLGSLSLASHEGPLRLQVDINTLDPVRAQALVKHPERLSGLQSEVTHDVAHSAVQLAVQSSAAVLLGATTLGLVVYRRPRRALAAGGLSLALLAGCAGSAYATWNPKSVLEPKFSGLLSSAPSVVGNARSIVSDFDVYQQELARLVTNMTRLYDAASTLPAYNPDPSTLRVLHVSDIHLNPAAWPIIQSMVAEYKIDMIIDTGDLMDHGTTAENGFTASMPNLGAPYVFVRGNHDSLSTQQSVASRKGAYVVDNGKSVLVKGVRIAGIGDPQFTPDRTVVAVGDPAERTAGRSLAAAIRRQNATGSSVDIAIAHNPVAAAETDGTVPLALAGHLHHRETSVLAHGTRLMLEGSTGGGGLRAVQNKSPEKVEASVLYLDRDTHRLQAWDEITLGGLGLTTAEVSRHLPGEIKPGHSASPTPVATPVHTPVPTPEPTPVPTPEP